MTVEADIRAALLPVCARVFPDFAPVNETRPYVTYQQIGGEAPGFLGREVPSKQHGIFQINVWSNTRIEAAALAIQIEAAMVAATAFQASAESAPVADFDADVPVRGTRQDFGVWSDR